MAKVEIRNGSRWWYGRLQVGSKRQAKNLGIAVEGIRPCRQYPDGDEAFVESRVKAEAKLESIRAESLKKAQTQDLLQAIHQARTGKTVGTILLNDLAPKWEAIPRRRSVAPSYIQWGRSVIASFVDFLRAQHPPKTEMCDVDEDLAQAFMDQERARGVAPRTWNAELMLLRSAFKHLRRQAGMPENPFEGIPTLEDSPIHRKPFSPDDLQAILQAATSDPLLHPVIVTGMCTAMRLGDVCLLKWADVDLKNRFVNVKTSKTQTRVSIPVFPLLHRTLCALPQTGAYVFPEVARLYKDGHDAINHRLRKIFAKAGFFNKTQKRKTLAAPGRPENWPELAAGKVNEAPLPDARKAKLLQVLSLYAGGAGTAAIAKAADVSKGSVSNYLHAIETLAGFPIVRRLVSSATAHPHHRADMRVTREHGLRDASIHGFHSLRTTWVTLALTAGIPIDLVRKVTGHQTADIVLANYFQPGREQFRKVLQSKMPALLSNGAKTPLEQAIDILRRAKATTWRKAIHRALALLEEQAA
jgi:integrase